MSNDGRKPYDLCKDVMNNVAPNEYNPKMQTSNKYQISCNMLERKFSLYQQENTYTFKSGNDEISPATYNPKYTTIKSNSNSFISRTKRYQFPSQTWVQIFTVQGQKVQNPAPTKYFKALVKQTAISKNTSIPRKKRSLLRVTKSEKDEEIMIEELQNKHAPNEYNTQSGLKLIQNKIARSISLNNSDRNIDPIYWIQHQNKARVLTDVNQQKLEIHHDRFGRSTHVKGIDSTSKIANCNETISRNKKKILEDEKKLSKMVYIQMRNILKVQEQEKQKQK